MVSERSQIKEGRWFLTASFAVMGKPLNDKQRAEGQARLLLQRYGILVKEWYRREQGLLGWYPIFQALKRLEWRGEIRRGYFVSGLSGVQFALPEALQLLENMSRVPAAEDAAPVLLNSLDPALPYGGGLDPGLMTFDGSPLKVVRSASNHLLLVDGDVILVCENHFQRLWAIKELSEFMWQETIQILKRYLKMPDPLKRGNRIEIHQVNNVPAAASPWTEYLINSGFEKDGDHLVLWSQV